MRWSNSKIGFDDRLVMLVGIPLFSFLVPVIFFGWRIGQPPYYPLAAYWPSFAITTVIWITCRWIMIRTRQRYASFTQVKKRLMIQTSLILLTAILVNNLLSYLLKDVCEDLMRQRNLSFKTGEFAINCNAAAIFSTLLVCAIYESIYFMNELRKSVEEKEMLKRESLRAQLEALKTQVNPHFLFNNLNTLSAVIPDNPGQAIDFVQQLSRVYRHILEVKNEQSILLKEELDVLQAYAFLLKTRFGDNLDISIRVAEEKLQQKIVPLSLQILMENAIKHNVVSSARPLRIDVYTQDGRLIVSNNLQKKNQAYESTGIGLENIRNRYLLLDGRPIEVEEGPACFTVSIPLIGN
ncbi:histidine kinase [Flavitalea sp. BT771]|uniref:sensor histidine kinase n=1 Tax=Flavitalea sp. BT771 TaxID=3063329 RepID=UPI0026E1CFAD|nr:histidine kinase [Flavitalea sp. BT771]MDO6434737.1 histidine kinase [Flavitalea sp. BT771]MDV6223637.1 histidine kinase [Flavitalea sp. BT771]